MMTVNEVSKISGVSIRALHHYDHIGLAFLALAGDLGAMVSPTMVGSLSEMAGGNLKTGLLAATIFPIVLVFGLLILKKKVSKATKE